MDGLLTAPPAWPQYSFVQVGAPGVGIALSCSFRGTLFTATGSSREGVYNDLAGQLAAAGAPDGSWAAFSPDGWPLDTAGSLIGLAQCSSTSPAD